MTDAAVREALAAIEPIAQLVRESASEGEAQGAAAIADELRRAGAERVRLEAERVHGTYWWPLGTTSALAAVAALSRRRGAAALAGFAVAALADDLWPGRRWFRRRFLRQRTTVNVIGELGPPDAARTVVCHAHHDAAHSGRIFDPRIPRAAASAFPRLVPRLRRTPPLFWLVAAPPALATGALLAGARRTCLAAAGGCLASVATMVDIGRAQVVPGANDNLSGVAVLLALARSLAGELPPETRVLLLSTGSEESFLEGMQRWGERHFGGLPRGRTAFVCLEGVGSSRLLVLEGEGMLNLHRYPAAAVARVRAEARRLGIELEPPFRFRFATDGEIPLLAGYPTVVIGSIEPYRSLRNYHWPTDVPAALDRDSIGAATALARAAVRVVADELSSGAR